MNQKQEILDEIILSMGDAISKLESILQFSKTFPSAFKNSDKFSRIYSGIDCAIAVLEATEDELIDEITTERFTYG